MTSGVEGYNSAGQVIFSETSYAGNFVGSFNTGGQKTGSFVDASLIGRILIHFLPQSISLYGGPKVTLDPNSGTVTWNYDIQVQGQGAPPIPSETIWYGGY
ncbi:hypothetical protein [Sphingomonas xinjiangensis]|uniref:Uncharacterized protein n=1 Tax=Sphingomonas xinjiangensis TaxID=643568 RepID=A0A840YKE2_9SPHN|nr:hypothetical protein [Sphingomonas xinjiangensis]MBB5709450.1 hypothetical protein [Sphingomonas xinjiangensis]